MNLYKSVNFDLERPANISDKYMKIFFRKSIIPFGSKSTIPPSTIFRFNSNTVRNNFLIFQNYRFY